MKIPIFMIFQFFGAISSWAVKALEDGKVTADEGLELVEKLAGIIGVPLELAVPKEVTASIKEITGEPDNKENAAFLSKPDFYSPGE